MAEWHASAREYLDGYLQQVAALAQTQGDDPEEITQGLRAHVEAALDEQEGPVSVEHLRGVLAELGTPEEVLESPPPMDGAVKAAKRVEPKTQVMRQPASKSCLYWSAAGCLGLVAAIVAVGILSTIAAIVLPNLSRARQQAENARTEKQVIEDLNSIYLSQQEYLQKQRRKGNTQPVYTGNFQELLGNGWRDKLHGLEENPHTRVRYAWRLETTGAPEDPGFKATATPVDPNAGLRTYSIDETGQILYSDDLSPPDTPLE